MNNFLSSLVYGNMYSNLFSHTFRVCQAELFSCKRVYFNIIIINAIFMIGTCALNCIAFIRSNSQFLRKKDVKQKIHFILGPGSIYSHFFGKFQKETVHVLLILQYCKNL